MFSGPLSLSSARTALFLGLGVVAGLRATAQTLVLNEVSNGPAGNMEYFEIAVVPVDPCTDQPCLDIRGWVFDDNNGAHGGNGVAPGCGRFSSNALWSCVPLGTLIVIYNSGDPNPSLPPDDLSLTDGNCTIIAGSGNSAYFEYTSTIPSTTDCVYPTGWGSGGWSTCLLANPGDCGRIQDANGCETSSVCYGNANGGSQIYIPGGQPRRVYFSSGDPSVQSTWSYGCAGSAQCGGDDQTPGTPNNAGNAAFLAPFSVCAGVTLPDPIAVTATSTNTCACTGTADASASGSVPGYTYAWYNDAWTAIGQTSAQATGLCPGIYHVIGTSSVGCADTATVTVGSLPGASLTLTSPTAAACGSATGVACVEVSGGTGTSTLVWDDPAAQTTPCATGLPAGDYTVTATDEAGCTSSSTVSVADSVPNVSLTFTTARAACGSATGSACATVVNGGPATWDFLWDDPAAQTTACATALLPGGYNVTVTDANGCTATGAVNIADSIPDVSVTATSNPASCGSASGQACATIVNGGSVTWDLLWNDASAQTTACATALLPGDYTVTATDANGCSASTTVTVDDAVPVITVAEAVDVSCAGLTDGHITLTLPDNTHTLSWTGPNGFTASTATIDGLAAGTYTYVWAEGTACALTASITLSVPLPIGLTATPTDATCAGVCDGTIDLTVDQGVAPFSYALNDVAEPSEPFTAVCAGVHQVRVTDSNGCFATTNATVNDGPPGPNADISPLDPLCVNAPAVAIDAVDPSGMWSGQGIANSADGLFDPALAGAGMHWVYHRIAGACSDADSIQVLVMPDPIASFYTSPENPSELNINVALLNNSVNATTYTWTLGGLPLSTSSDTYFPVVQGITSYSICLIAEGLPYCVDTVCQDIVLAPELRVFVPNSFTPDGDGINDVFGPVFSTPPKECTLIVFDRWGKELFHANAYTDAHWDGGSTKNDVFVWRLDYRDPNTLDRNTLTGHVTLLR